MANNCVICRKPIFNHHGTWVHQYNNEECCYYESLFKAQLQDGDEDDAN